MVYRVTVEIVSRALVIAITIPIVSEIYGVLKEADGMDLKKFQGVHFSLVILPNSLIMIFASSLRLWHLELLIMLANVVLEMVTSVENAKVIVIVQTIANLV
jgi:membrane protein insertase Oxa1/YidC/SpoIIIJ